MGDTDADAEADPDADTDSRAPRPMSWGGVGNRPSASVFGIRDPPSESALGGDLGHRHPPRHPTAKLRVPPMPRPMGDADADAEADPDADTDSRAPRPMSWAGVGNQPSASVFGIRDPPSESALGFGLGHRHPPRHPTAKLRVPSHPSLVTAHVLIRHWRCASLYRACHEGTSLHAPQSCIAPARLLPKSPAPTA
jgi:hypothetical protein